MAGLLTMAPPMAPTSTPQVSNGSNGSNSNGQNIGPRGPPNSTLLFGFLVSFLALFIIFMIFGLGSRHYLDLRRRQRRILEAGQGDETSEVQEPALWDVSLSYGEKEKWEELMPLSVVIQRDRSDEMSTEASEALRAQQALAYLSQLSATDRFFYSCGELFHKIIIALWPTPGGRLDVEAPQPRNMTSLIKPENTADEVNLQVSILIAMPSPHRRQQPDDTTKLTKEAHDIERLSDEGLLPDIAIGVTSVLWDKERANFG